MQNDFTPELIEKAKQAKSSEELITLAKENGIDISNDEAEEYFERLNNSGELSDEELDNVAGGCGGGAPDERLSVTKLYSCEYFVCADCHIWVPAKRGDHLWQFHNCNSDPNHQVYVGCEYCKYLDSSRGDNNLRCNHGNNKG